MRSGKETGHWAVVVMLTRTDGGKRNNGKSIFLDRAFIIDRGFWRECQEI